MLIAPEVTKPGRTFYAPDVRIIKLKGSPKKADKVEPLADVVLDVISVEVTLKHSGPGQYAITLNNWIDTLPTEPPQKENIDHNPKDTQQIKPGLPPFKYNDFSLLQFGERLRIDMRYWPDTVSDAEKRTQNQSWTPMIAGPITDIKFTFSTSSGAQITVSGVDDLRPLQDKNRKRFSFPDNIELKIIETALNRPEQGFAFTIFSNERWPSFMTQKARGLAEALEEGQSTLQFLQKFADRYDFEIFMQFTDLDSPDSEQQFHFEPSRSRLPPREIQSRIIVLEREEHLIDFAPTIKVAEQYTSVCVKGKHRIRNRLKKIDQLSKPEILNDELYREVQLLGPVRNSFSLSLPSFGIGTEDPELVPGPVLRREIYGDNCQTLDNIQNIDDERALEIANTKLRQKAREFMTIKGTTIGLPRLRPGNYVEIRGYRAPFDGFYYVTETVHRYGNDGLRTNFSARRPGMPRMSMLTKPM